MLLNSSSVFALGLDDSYQTTIAGKLQVMNRARERWESKWASLKGNLLYLFQRKQQPSAGAALLIIEDSMVELGAEDEGDLAFRIRFLSSGNIVTFLAETDEEQNAWVTALATCSTNHAKLTLQSLQEKVDGEKEDQKQKQRPQNPETDSKSSGKNKTGAKSDYKEASSPSHSAAANQQPTPKKNSDKK